MYLFTGEKMKKLGSYFNSNNYYDPNIIIHILEDVIGKDYNSIRDYIINSDVKVNESEITNFLNQSFLDCDSKIKKRVNTSDLRYANSDRLFGEDQGSYLKNCSEYLDEYLAVRKYTFEPYTLEYFKKYISILKSKILVLLDIVCNINSDILEYLDIVLDSNGYMSKEDIVRLITPILYNINLLDKMVADANDLSTYLSFKMSRFLVYKNGLSDNEIYPSKSLQIDNLLCSEDGYVALSSNQRKKLEKKNTIKR